MGQQDGLAIWCAGTPDELHSEGESCGSCPSEGESCGSCPSEGESCGSCPEL
jgi:hypothetical protein